VVAKGTAPVAKGIAPVIAKGTAANPMIGTEPGTGTGEVCVAPVAKGRAVEGRAVVVVVVAAVFL
jgi:hypothetical protein